MSKARDIADLNVTILDSVESGATADQSNAEIRAAVESATDSNVFTDADHTKLNSIDQGVATTDSPTFVDVTATSLDISGNIDVDGVTNLDVVDVDGAVDMASTLQVDGAATFNSDVNIGGNLVIPSSINHTGDTNTFIKFNAADQIQLATGGVERVAFYNSETHFNDSGADVDFIVESDGNANMLFVDGGVDRVGVGRVPTTDVLEVAGNLKLKADNAEINLRSGVAGTSGAINWTFNTDTTNYASISLPYDSRASLGLHMDAGYPITIDSSSSAGVTVLASTVGKNVFNSSSNTFNELGNNVDFRVESDGASHALFVEGSSNYVGLNTSAPTQPLSLGTRTGANLNYIDGTTNSAATDTGIFVSGSTTNDQSTKLGMLLANNANNNGARSPIIGFSALSASNSYNHMYAAINGRKIGNGADTNWNHGQIEFCTSTGTGPTVRMILDYNGGLITKPNTGGHTVFNENSVDADFRVESNGNANMLKVDGGEDRVLVATSTVSASNPNASLQVGGDLTFQNYGLNSNTVTDTGISINQGANGMAMQVLASNHNASGANTKAGQYFLKFYYSGNNAPAVTLVAGDNCVTFGVSGSNTLTVQMPAGGNSISFITSG